MCECRSLAHPTPQDGSWLCLASLSPFRLPFHYTNAFRLSFVRFLFLVRSFCQGKGPGDIDSGRKSKNIAIASLISGHFLHIPYLLSLPSYLLENYSRILAQFGDPDKRLGARQLICVSEQNMRPFSDNSKNYFGVSVLSWRRSKKRKDGPVHYQLIIPRYFCVLGSLCLDVSV
jgi:hypothetical protein